MTKKPSQVVGNAGLFYVCYKLSMLGWNVMPTSRNARGIDVMCFSMDGTRMLSVQVKSLSKKNPVPIGVDHVYGLSDRHILCPDTSNVHLQ